MFALYSYWARDVHNKEVREIAMYTFLLGIAELLGVVLLSQLGNNRLFGLYATVIISMAVSGVVALLAGVCNIWMFQYGCACVSKYVLVFV